MASAAPVGTILVAGPEDLGKALAFHAESMGYDVVTAASADDAALALSGEREFVCALIDLDCTGALDGILSSDPGLPVVAVTPAGSLERAKDAMRRGARDFIERPWEPTRLERILANQAELRRALQDGRRLARENRRLRAERRLLLRRLRQRRSNSHEADAGG